MTDLRFALRMLLRSPGLTAAAVLALALGIGANSALFTVVNKALLTPLPFQEPDRIVSIWSTALANKITQSAVSGPDFLDWQKRNRTFSAVAAAQINCRFNLTGRGEPVSLKGSLVTPSFFDVFNTPMQIGRRFVEDDTQPGHEHRLILSHGIWVRTFGSDPSVVGKTVNINGHSHEVVGVLPPTLGFIEEMIEAYAPFPKARLEEGRMSHYLGAFGRLKPGVTVEQARNDLATITSNLAQDYPDQKGWSVKLVPLREDLVRMIRPMFIVLHAAVGFLLLIACANVANLLLARAETRSKEMAIRASLGANRARVVRQLLTESVVLSLSGAVLGLFLALWGIDLLRAFSPKVRGASIPMLAEMSLDGRVFAFTFLLAVLTGLVFGLVPAWHASRSNLTETLKEAGRGAVGGLRRHRWLSTFVVAQVALCMILLVGAGLMLRNLQRLTHADPGFDPANVLSLEMELPNSRYTNEPMRLSFYRDVIERIQAQPGVEAVGAVNLLPMGNNNSNWAFGIEGGPPLEKGKYNLAEYRVVSPDYFRALRIPLKQGRVFTSQDNGQGLCVMVINETLAKRYFPGENPIGRRITFSSATNGLEIVGVVGDQKHFGLGAEAPPIIYQPFTQNCWNLMSLVVRAKVEPMSLANAVREQVWAVDKDQPITKLRPMDDVVRDSISVQRFSAVLLLGFAGAGLLLAAIGIYGVLAYVVSQRTHEIGVRLALGAQVRDILRMVVGQGLMLTGLGLGIGLLLSLALGRVMQVVLYEMSGNDPWTFGAVSIVLGVVAAVACYLPARRATRVDPIVALRYE